MSERQLVFRSAFVDELAALAKAGQTDNEYFKEGCVFPTSAVQPSAIVVPSVTPHLSGGVEEDLVNAIRLFEYLNLSPLQASDERLWTFLSLTTFRPYLNQRWPQAPKGEAGARPGRGARIISQRWLMDGSSRSFGRHALARLWWAVHITSSNWDKFPQELQDSLEADRYYLTRLLFSNQDLVQQMLDRQIGWSGEILAAILMTLKDYDILSGERTTYRALFREVNLMIRYRRLAALGVSDIVRVLRDSMDAVMIGDSDDDLRP